MLLRREFVDVFLCIKFNLTFVCTTQIFYHLLLIHTVLQTQIYTSAFSGIQHIVALILCILHTELLFDIFCQRMYLKAKILSAHRIQEVKSDWEFRTEACINLFTKQRLWLIQHQIHCRNFHNSIRKFQIQGVFLRYTVKAPCEIGFFTVKITDLLHPLSAPYTRIKIWNGTEWLLSNLLQCITQSSTRNHFRIICLIGINQPVDILKH